MKRLSGADSLYLAGENPAMGLHVGALILLDPSTAPAFSIDTLKETLGQRLAALPKFRSKVKEVPFQLDRPVWVDDRSFDLERHVRHIAVPPPGGRREMGDLVGQLMSYQLDRRFPLWEAWFVEGVNEGRHIALFLKSHHALMDGVTGAGLLDRIFDLEPTPEPRAIPEPADEPGGRAPSDLELLVRALPTRAMAPIAASRYAGATAQRAVIAAMAARRSGGDLPGLSAPASAFNGAVGRRRRSAFVSVSLDDVKRLRKVWGVKVNDVVLGLVAGMARTYLSERGQLPDEPLAALMAVNTRADGDTGGGNQGAPLMARLPTHLADPVERIRAIQRSTEAAKGMLEAVRSKKIQSLGEVAPPLLVHLASQALFATNASRRLPPPANIAVSNIPGPPVALYAGGARVLGFYTASVLLVNVAVNITCVSYEDRIDFGLIVDPDVVPDPWALADGLAAALAELLHAADLGEPEAVRDPFAKAPGQPGVRRGSGTGRGRSDSSSTTR